MLGQHAQIILSLMALSAVGFSSPLSSSSGSVMPENNVYRRQLGPVTVEPISGFSSDKKARDEVPEATVSRRQLGPVVTDPIPSFTPSRLKARDAVQNLEARSSMGGCGGNTWAPVSAYLQAVDEFCQTIQGTTVQHGMQQSASYGAIALTGNLGYGHAVLIYKNKTVKPGWQVDYQTCVTGLTMVSSPGNKCYGKKNDDVQGGTYHMDGVGEWDSEVDKGSSS